MTADSRSGRGVQPVAEQMERHEDRVRVVSAGAGAVADHRAKHLICLSGGAIRSGHGGQVIEAGCAGQRWFIGPASDQGRVRAARSEFSIANYYGDRVIEEHRASSGCGLTARACDNEVSKQSPRAAVTRSPPR
jgi:hypothetical protein